MLSKRHLKVLEMHHLTIEEQGQNDERRLHGHDRDRGPDRLARKGSIMALMGHLREERGLLGEG
jgi:hypothetical protein